VKDKLIKLGAIAFAMTTPLSLFACGDPKPNGDNSDPPDPPVEEWTIPQGSWSHSDRIMYVRDLGYCTGEKAFVDTSEYNMTGTDLGFSFYDDELKRLYVSFGDTNNNKVQGGGNEFQSNVTLYTDNLDFTSGIKWTGALAGQNGASRQVTPLAHRIAAQNQKYWGNVAMGDVTNSNVISTIPTGALCLNGTYYIWYMEVRGEFEATGEWSVYRNCVVKSEDKGVTWTKVQGLDWVCYDSSEQEGIAPNFGQICPLDGNDGYVYIYGIPGGRSGGVKLGRVAYDRIEDFESYEYYRSQDADGNVDWRKGSNGLRSIKAQSSSYIVAPMCGEISVCYNPYLRRFVMTYLQGNTSIVIRRSSKPWGKWSDSDVIMNQSDMNGLYGGFGNSALMTHDGKRMYLFVSEWYPAYNVHFVEVVFN